MRRADRWFRLVQLLRRRRQSTARDLAELLEVSERTVYRDIAELIGCGLPIRGEAGVGYIIERGFELPPLMFTADEVEALALGARAVQRCGDPTLAGAAGQLLAKVEAALPPGLLARVSAAPLFAPGLPLPEDAARELGTLRQAISDRRKLALEYVDRAALTTARVVRPIGLAFWGSSWTLLAWCELREAFRAFRLDRVERLWLMDETFEEESGRRLADYLDRERAIIPADRSRYDGG
jgi:predicted DNA-binding transcriptional regulator YafY